MIPADKIKYDYLPYCPVCRTKDIETELKLHQINLTESVYLCQVPHCSYPEGYSWLVVEAKTANVEDSDDDEFDLDDFDIASETNISEISPDLVKIPIEFQAVSKPDNVGNHLLFEQKEQKDFQGFEPSSNTIESNSSITLSSDQLETTCKEVSNSVVANHSNVLEMSQDCSVEPMNQLKISTKTINSSNPVESKQIMTASKKDISSNRYNVKSKLKTDTKRINKSNRFENIKSILNTVNHFKELISHPHCNNNKHLRNDKKIDKIPFLPLVENKQKLPGWQATSKETQKKITCTIDSNVSLLESSQSAKKKFKFDLLKKRGKKVKKATTVKNDLKEANSSNSIVLSGLDGPNIKTKSRPKSVIHSKGSLKEAFVLKGLKYESKTKTIQINNAPQNKIKLVSLKQLNLIEKLPAIESNALASVNRKESRKINIIPGCKTNTEFRYRSEIIKPATKTHLNQCEQTRGPEEKQAVEDIDLEDLVDNLSKTEVSYPEIPEDQFDIDDWLKNL